MIHIRRQHRLRTGQLRGNRHQPGPRSEIEHAFARDRRTIVQNVACQRLSPRPGKGPIGRGHAHFFQFFFGLAPDRHHFCCQMQFDFRHQRRRKQFGIGADERGWVAQAAAACGLEAASRSTSP